MMNNDREEPDRVQPLSTHIVGIAQLCEAFEQQWRVGQRPNIASYLPRVSVPLRAELLRKLVALEVVYRRRTGEDVDFAEYQQRFPEYAETLPLAWQLLPGWCKAPDGYSSDSAHSSENKDIPAQGEPGTIVSAASPIEPKQIGRYQIQAVLGKGNFGAVYRAVDTQLQRLVALKVPHGSWITRARPGTLYLQEARAAAQLTHPGLVSVYDVQQEGNSICIVQEYVDGQDLAHWAAATAPDRRRIVNVMIEIVEAVGYAHQHALVHRDLKPANILVDQDGHAHVADFGLAISETLQQLKAGETCGTPAYMSPEQVRGETHRLDGRSDLWSLGVILYELLTGRRPFLGDTSSILFDEIQHRDPRPPRMIQPAIPSGLERIVLKCLAKRATDRYGSAAELAEDLRAWLTYPKELTDATASNRLMPVAPLAGVIPKGLRSFDERDADFFLQLLPGPRDREGLPDSIRFWKTRIEETDPDNTFAVGLIYGPSGCGKSSLVKAGLLPRLAEHVATVYVEATPDETELRLRNGLQKHIGQAAVGVALPELLAGFREGRATHRDEKILIVLDQFEQWLHARRTEQDTQLVQALRHCDGRRLQCIVSVRDDFWVAASRFMRELEVPLLEGKNSALVDLFDPLHARMVLAAFGRAYGRLPEGTVAPSPDQEDFLDRAVEGLAQDGKIICVRLALFADMLKGKPWTTASLSQVGGTEGLGVMFLEETFSVSTAPAAHRYHQRAAQAILAAMLPEPGSDIRGSRRSYESLLQISGYAARPSEFNDLIQILDGEIRLITPTLPVGENTDIPGVPETSEVPARAGEAEARRQKYYQLTHDYLVPSLRDWLTRKQQETRQGRAELRLAERSSLWNAKPENQQLPSWWEDLSIRWFTDRKKWTEPQRRMMQRAAHYFGLRTVIALTLLAVAVAAGETLRRSIQRDQKRLAAEKLVDSLLQADVSNVPTIVRNMDEYQQWVAPMLADQWAKVDDKSPEKLHLAMALLESAPEHVDFLYDALLTANTEQFPVIRSFLANHQDQVRERLWTVLQESQPDPGYRRLRAAGALAVYDPYSAKWNDVAAEIVGQLMEVNPAFVRAWQDALRPVADQLVPPLTEILADPRQKELTRSLATEVLADYAKDDPEKLTSLVVVADAKAFGELFPVLQQHGPEAIRHLRAVLACKVEPSWNDSPLDPDWKDVAPEVRATIETAHGILADRFAFCQDVSWEEFLRIHEALEAGGYGATRIRPWICGDRLLVAAVWTRDGRRRELQTGLTVQQLPASEAPAEKDGLLPADIAVAPSTDPEAAAQFVLLWGPAVAAGEQRRIIVDLTGKELVTTHNSLVKEGFPSQSTICVWTDNVGLRHYAGIWSNQGAPSVQRAAYPGFELTHDPQWDVAVAPPAALSLPDPLAACREQLEQIAALPSAQREQPQVRLLRAQAEYYLAQLEPALADLDYLVEKHDVSTSVLQLRAWVLARLGKADEAHAVLAKYAQQEGDPSMQAYVRIALEAWSSNWDETDRQLAAAVTTASLNADSLYNLACAAAQASQACAESDTERSQKYANRAMELLETAVTSGFDDAQRLRSDTDLVQLHGDPRFSMLLAKLEPPAPYAAVWQADVEREAKLTGPLSLESLRDEAQELGGRGFRPVAIAISDVQESNSATATPQVLNPKPLASVVWHRPLVPDRQKEQLAARQAGAAVALLRMGQADQVWPLLRHQPDPRLRSHLLSRLASYGVEPELLWQRCMAEQDESIRRALILALGDCADAKLLSDAQQITISAELLRYFQEEVDPGIHGAAEWTLQKLGRQEELLKTRSALATGNPLGHRRWYVTKQGDHTMVILHSRESFLMGSPIFEAQRDGGPTGRVELRHRQTIDRRFAIASHEVTVHQFLAFQKDINYSKQISPTDDAPINGITWYRAAQYCNWLSQQEGLPEDQWCYNPSQPFADGMQLYPDYLRRTGYRLPTEAEWEYACRALATTSRPYGETTALLGEYAWYIENSKQRWMLSVGSLKPNDFGLFDMLGNAFEWCQDQAAYYSTDCEVVLDAEQGIVVRENKGRVLRGGSYTIEAWNARAANRYFSLPVNPVVNYGFRVARTCP